MASSPVIFTPRLRLEPFSEKHLSERYVGWLNDPDGTKYSEQRHRRHTLESCRQYMKSFHDTPNYFWAIVAREPPLGHIGNLNAYVEPVHSVADVGILIGEATARGKGLATEAWVAACDYLLRQAGIRKVTAGTVAPNKPMLALMDRVGMCDDGRRVRQCLWNGQEVDMIHGALFRENWLSEHPNGPFDRNQE